MIEINRDIVASIVEAQTREMNESGETVILVYRRVVSLLREVRSRYRPGKDMVQILESVLNQNEPFSSDSERHAYKRVLGLELYRCKAEASRVQDELDRTRPFDHQEQDM